MASISGGAWAGPTQSDMYVRTLFADCGHGADFQASNLLLNFHAMCTKEGGMPEEWYIGADNTYSETKNQFVIMFSIWRLAFAIKHGWNLVGITFMFLLVGHTHNRLDRFFSRLAVAIRGHDYFTLPEMFKIILEAVPSNQIFACHLYKSWNWKELEKSLPGFKGLGHVHAINIHQHNGGVWMKWKHYLTDQLWSKPHLVLPPAKVQQTAALRVTERRHEFREQRAMLAWIDKLEMFLGEKAGRHREQLMWFREVANSEAKEYSDGPDLEEILTELTALCGRNVAHHMPITGTAEDVPPDAIVQMRF